jgi:hypothetical protein
MVTTMGLIFSGATAFNQPIGDWGVSKVTTIERMLFLLHHSIDLSVPGTCPW